MKKLKLSDNALTVLTKRDYLKRDKDGRITETPEQMFRRVAKAIASHEVNAKGEWEERFFQAMASLEFLPTVTGDIPPTNCRLL